MTHPPLPIVDEGRETAWLIERAGPFWWRTLATARPATIHIIDATNSLEWTADANEAVRFSRKEDADHVAAALDIPRSLMTSTEHVFITSLVSPPTQAGGEDRITEIIVEPFTDTVVLMLTGEGETVSAILDTSYAAELRDKLNVALEGHPLYAAPIASKEACGDGRAEIGGIAPEHFASLAANLEAVHAGGVVDSRVLEAAHVLAELSAIRALTPNPGAAE